MLELRKDKVVAGHGFTNPAKCLCSRIGSCVVKCIPQQGVSSQVFTLQLLLWCGLCTTTDLPALRRHGQAHCQPAQGGPQPAAHPGARLRLHPCRAARPPSPAGSPHRAAAHAGGLCPGGAAQPHPVVLTGADSGDTVRTDLFTDRQVFYHLLTLFLL